MVLTAANEQAFRHCQKKLSAEEKSAENQEGGNDPSELKCKTRYADEVQNADHSLLISTQMKSRDGIGQTRTPSQRETQ